MSMIDAILRAGRIMKENNAPIKLAAYVSVDEAAALYDEVTFGLTTTTGAPEFNQMKAKAMHNGEVFGTRIFVEGMK